MKTEYRFAEALKSMMSEYPLDDISVTALCKKCRVNRQTFYYHFHDIYDLLTLVFLNEEIPNVHESTTIKEMVSYIYKYYIKNAGFIDATVNSAGKDLFQEFMYNTCYITFMRFVEQVPENKKLKPNDSKAIARFYALAYSNSIVYYLSTFKQKSFDGLMMCFCFENDQNVVEAVRKFAAIRSKR